MKFKFLSVITASLLFSWGQTYAQEILTLQQAVKFALDNKKEAKNSKLDLENAQYQIDEVRSGALPQVTGVGSLTYNPLIQQNVIVMEDPATGQSVSTVIQFGQPWQANSNLQVTQQIFNQALFTGLKAARTTREFYQVNKELTDEQLIEKVANAYYQVFQSQLQVATVESNLGNTEKNQRVIQGLVDAGLAKKIDLDRTTVQVNNLKAQLQQAKNTMEIQENALKFAMGMEITNQIDLPDETFAIDAQALENLPIDLDNRTEIRVLEKQTELLELDKKAKIADYYPTLSFSGNLGYMSFAQRFPIFNGNATKTAYSALGLNLSIPIFNGGKTKSQVSQKNIEILRAKVELEDTKLALTMASENARTQVKNSLITINSNEGNVKLAKEVLDNTENNYKNGLATLTELLDAENAYADAQNNLNNSLLDYKVAEVQLIKSKGNLKTLVNE
ncbi:TolC family protein [Sphingobacterium deserti]|uniref:Outer membrane efflux protein n=1 Tax=Sphingobacterium deserti TaxID=1229276 RepID=A0A0B8T2F0_9SPHI|nr:TolC family protein [Sphingobacterium deserti]KGE13008.1 outer membrane efflux protein [Sphingobacterium deserti]